MAADIETTVQGSEVTRERRRQTAPRAPRSSARPLRSVGIFGAVLALVAGIALPALASTRPTAATADVNVETLQQAARQEAQSLVVASAGAEVADEGAVVVADNNEQLGRGNYSATTPAEIAQKKAEEAARERAAALQRAAAAAAAAAKANPGGGGTTTAFVPPPNVALTAPGSGEVRYPVTPGTYNVTRTLSSYHNGADMVGSAGLPLYAAAAGTVRISSEGHWGYGVAVVIDHVIGGQSVSTLYGHMLYGSRQVQAGQYVEAGQLIGYMGSTGRSTANHLHFEVRINDSLVEPINWLAQNAG